MNDLDKERQTEGRKAWYAVQTFYCKEEHLGKYLEKKGVNYFIPMRYIEHETLDGKKHRKLYTICCLSRKNLRKKNY